MTPPSQQGYSRESSYASTNSSTSSSCYRGTIHDRRTMSRTSSFSPPPPSLHGFSELFHSRVSSPPISPVAAPKSSTNGDDRERWVRMLRMQREFRCYKSARLEAAVEALENGVPLEEVPVPSRLCLDLINEELKAQIDATKMLICY